MLACVAAFDGSLPRARHRSVLPSMRRPLHALGTVLLAVGVLALAWSLIVWRWQDPVTGLYTAYEQHRLSGRLAALVAAESRPPSTPEEIRAAARRFRLAAKPGRPIGRIAIPRLGISFVVVEGTDSASLRLGPGRDARSFMPGEGNLVYIAGHRTTFLAPFSHIDELRRGDRITLTMPYGTFVYVVSGHTIVAANDLRVLRPRSSELLALQACHPRFFATHRYIVWARLLRVIMRPRT